MTLKLGARRRGLIVPSTVHFLKRHAQNTCAVDNNRRQYYIYIVVVVCTIVVAQTSDTSDVGVVAQREVDQ